MFTGTIVNDNIRIQCLSDLQFTAESDRCQRTVVIIILRHMWGATFGAYQRSQSTKFAACIGARV